VPDKYDKFAPSNANHFIKVLADIKHGNGNMVDAIICHTLIDNHLEQVLRICLPRTPEELDKLLSRGGLRTYHARVNACFKHGIIGPVARCNLNRIGSIRNTFAHTLLLTDSTGMLKGTSFDLPPICDWCDNLTAPDLAFDKSWKPKTKFVRMCLWIAVSLSQYITDPKRSATEPLVLP
jgi:hypothetical protein